MKWAALASLLMLIIAGCARVENTGEMIIKSTGDTMKLTSNAFKQGEMIPKKYTCQGDNINPRLIWEDAPSGTKSFALIFDDPDAPMGTFTHWLIKDIPADVNEIKENSVPGTEVVNSLGRESYGGPCPPSGTHRYIFKLYALSVETFDVIGKEDFYKWVEQHKIEQAVLMGKYSKS